MRGIIDRFEDDDWVVIEIDGITKDFKRSILPKDADVGDVVEIDGETVNILEKETAKLRAEIEDLMNELWEDE